MSNQSMITTLLDHAFALEDDSPDEQHLKVSELIHKLVERDKVLVDALKDIVQESMWASRTIVLDALKAIGEDV